LAREIAGVLDILEAQKGLVFLYASAAICFFGRAMRFEEV
jgi:hypothetical protein